MIYNQEYSINHDDDYLVCQAKNKDSLVLGKSFM